MPKTPNYDDLPVSLTDRATVGIGLGETTPMRSYFINCCCGFVRERRTESELEMLQGGSRCGAFNDPFPYACPQQRAFKHKDFGCEPDDVGQWLLDDGWRLVQGGVSESEWATNGSAGVVLWIHPKCLAVLKRAGQARNGYAHYRSGSQE
jgi:hypothetical protein